MNRLLHKAMANPVQVALGAAVLIGVVYYLGRKTLSDTASAAGGLVTGNNAITAGTPYAGKGIVGTIAGTANAASGGALQSIGEALGGWLYDVTHKEYDPNKGKQSNGDVLRQGSANTDCLWGRIGGVELRN